MKHEKKILISVLLIGLTGCNIPERLATVGQTPPLAQIENPTKEPKYKPVEMPMPDPEFEGRKANSLWQPGARSFFKDQRANKVGDILTILIQVQDQGQLNNKTTRKRSSQMQINTPSLLGYNIGSILPKDVNRTTPLNMTSSPNHVGEGDVNRQEQINLKIAALVTQILPNGNMVIQGKQEIRVNFEVREVFVGGIVRKEDILADNTLSYEKIAEARIAYGGRGQLTDMQQPPYGQQIIDAVLPF